MKHSIFILITVLLVRPNVQSDLEASKKLKHISKEWISKIPQLIDEATAKFKKEGSKTTVERVSFGWSIVAGSILDSLSSYIKEKNDDNLKEGVYENDKVLHTYSHLLSYGVGFGFPWLLTLPDDAKKCGKMDFVDTLKLYDLEDGVDGLYDKGATVSDVSSILKEFQAIVLSRLNCFDATENVESLKVLNGVKNLIASLNARNEVEKRRQKQL